MDSEPQFIPKLTLRGHDGVLISDQPLINAAFEVVTLCQRLFRPGSIEFANNTGLAESEFLACCGRALSELIRLERAGVSMIEANGNVIDNVSQIRSRLGRFVGVHEAMEAARRYRGFIAGGDD